MEDEVRSLTVAEIRSSLLPYVIPSHILHSRKEVVVAHALSLTPHLKAQLSAASTAKKRRREEEAATRRVRRRESLRQQRRFDREAVQEQVLHELEVDTDKFLDFPVGDERLQCHRRYIQLTGNDAVRHETCGSCGRWVIRARCSQLPLSSIPAPCSFSPEPSSLPSDIPETFNDMLLEPAAIQLHDDGLSSWFCSDCLPHIRKKARPPLALANGMWIGPQPEELTSLSLPEQLLIAKAFPRCYVYKLFPRSGYHGERSGELQRGMRGNVTSYCMDIDGIARMIDGSIMPNPLSILPALIGVCIIGKGPLPSNWKKSTFAVRRDVVHRALLWLKQHNPLYSSITISSHILDSIPIDDVPDEIETIIREVPDETIVERESAGYVPCDDDLGVRAPMATETSADDDPHVIPLQYLGLSQTDMSQISAHDIANSAVRNLLSNENEEGAYAVRYGGLVSDFDRPASGAEAGETEAHFTMLACAYPSLFPYGKGGFNCTRRNGVSFASHVRWALDYHDRRFATHHSFPFVCFGVLQRMQALSSVKAYMRRRDFERDALELSRIKPADLERASREERSGAPISNQSVRKLIRHLRTMSSKVIGSNESRATHRGCIHGTTITENPPSIWTTWNFPDCDDPVAQVFAGKQIDLDDFNKLLGPDRAERTRTIALNPVAAASYFRFIVLAMLDGMFGISSGKFKVKRRTGIFGKVRAYYGLIEAQGRGSLHIHMFMWLANTPTSAEMLVLLQRPAFRDKVKRFIDQNIRAYIPDVSPDFLSTFPPENELAWTRPIHPDHPDFTRDSADLLRRVVRNQQLHKCRTTTCLRYNRITRRYECKRHAPWPEHEASFVTETGEWGPKRNYAYINNYCPDISMVQPMNHDVKLETNGADTRDGSFYATKYMTKYQGSSYNSSALVARGVAAHESRSQREISILDSNRLMLLRCFLALNREMEYSGPQVVTFLMGNGEAMRSHDYSPLYWSSVTSFVLREFPGLTATRPAIRSQPPSGDPDSEQTDNHQIRSSPDEDEDRVTLCLLNETIVSRSQLQDYRCRGEALESYNLLEFVKDTYEQPIKGNESFIEVNPSQRDGPGQPPHKRVLYTPRHSHHMTACRVIRPVDHKHLISVPGKFLPRNDIAETRGFYCASMLALLRPWRLPSDIRGTASNWESEFITFSNTAGKRVQDILSNIQYYYECSDAAEKRRRDSAMSGQDPSDTSRSRPTDATSDEFQDLDLLPTDEDEVDDEAEIVGLTHTSIRARLHGEEAVNIARFAGLFDSSVYAPISHTGLYEATGGDHTSLLNWKGELALQAARLAGNLPTLDAPPSVHSATSSTVTSLQHTTETYASASVINMSSNIQQSARLIDPAISETLNREQSTAYQLVRDQLVLYLSNSDPLPQLLMNLQGGPGTGKSQVIKAISDLFKASGANHLLIKAAYTGIAASVIDGITLHSLARLPTTSADPSQKSIAEMAAIYEHVRFLIIDEISMVSKSFFARLDRVFRRVADALGNGKGGAPFGGLDVMICGDFHQFPPVACSASAALYYPCPPSDNDKNVIGSQLYHSFTSIVILKQQMRSPDPRWNDLLGRARTGSCTSDDVRELRSLVLTNPQHASLAALGSNWNDAVLVTPRHTVRAEWNKAALQHHCQSTGNVKLTCKAEDTINGRPLTREERISTLEKTRKDRDKYSRNDCSALPPTLDLAVGMKVMMLANINPAIDIANGSRGVITKIVLDENETSDRAASQKTLTRLPTYVLVRLDKTKASPLENLDEGEIPIEPLSSTFTISTSLGKRTVTRRQLPLTAAYAFTDYRSQGQTIEYVIVDIAKPPTGPNITAFNAFVALSRSRGRARLRLLRNFDETLLTSGITTQLADEDARLAEHDLTK